METEKNLLLTVDVFTYGFIVLISLIAAANVFNTISTAFLLRRREFAVLSSVGMTPKEMSRMLNFECLLYGLKALLFGIPAALLVTYEIYRVVSASWATAFGFRRPAFPWPSSACSRWSSRPCSMPAAKCGGKISSTVSGRRACSFVRLRPPKRRPGLLPVSTRRLAPLPAFIKIFS